MDAYTAHKCRSEVPKISIDVVFLSNVYHGTLDIYLESFKDRLLNSRHWKSGRDFGQGLYTTASIDQAKAWARSMQDKLNVGLPCVLEIGFITNGFWTRLRVIILIGDWTA